MKSRDATLPIGRRFFIADKRGQEVYSKSFLTVLYLLERNEYRGKVGFLWINLKKSIK